MNGSRACAGRRRRGGAIMVKVWVAVEVQVEIHSGFEGRVGAEELGGT